MVPNRKEHEGIPNILPIVPVFGIHDLPNAYLTKERAIERGFVTGSLPDLHGWDEHTVKEIKRLQPRVLGIDGMHGEGRPSIAALQNLFLVSPISPFDLRWDEKDSFLVGGDICCASSPNLIVQTAFDRSLADNTIVFFAGQLTDKIIESNDLRNAVVSIKLRESATLLSNMGIDTKSIVALMGNGHERGNKQDIWNSPNAQEGCLRSALTKLLEEAYSIARDMGKNPEDSMTQELIAAVAQMIGQTDIWRIASGASSLSVADIRKYITLDHTSISSTITHITTEVAEAVKP